LTLLHFHAISRRAPTPIAGLNLVTGLLEVVGEGGDDRGGVSGLLSLAVDAEDDGGLGGSNGNTITTLTT
jgi:hypothetical protein